MAQKKDIQTLKIEITDEYEELTGKLEQIISSIRQGYTSGYGWKIRKEESR